MEDVIASREPVSGLNVAVVLDTETARDFSGTGGTFKLRSNLSSDALQVECLRADLEHRGVDSNLKVYSHSSIITDSLSDLRADLERVESKLHSQSSIIAALRAITFRAEKTRIKLLLRSAAGRIPEIIVENALRISTVGPT